MRHRCHNRCRALALTCPRARAGAAPSRAPVANDATSTARSARARPPAPRDRCRPRRGRRRHPCRVAATGRRARIRHTRPRCCAHPGARGAGRGPRAAPVPEPVSPDPTRTPRRPRAPAQGGSSADQMADGNARRPFRLDVVEAVQTGARVPDAERSCAGGAQHLCHIREQLVDRRVQEPVG